MSERLNLEHFGVQLGEDKRCAASVCIPLPAANLQGMLCAEACVPQRLVQGGMSAVPADPGTTCAGVALAPADLMYSGACAPALVACKSPLKPPSVLPKPVGKRAHLQNVAVAFLGAAGPPSAASAAPASVADDIDKEVDDFLDSL